MPVSNCEGLELMWNGSGEAEKSEAEFLQFALEGSTADTKELRRTGAVALGIGKGRPDRVGFERMQVEIRRCIKGVFRMRERLRGG